MSFHLDPDAIAAMTQEAKACFLDEDAPDYLKAFQDGLILRNQADFTLLLRAAHSLKGGAGLAQLSSLQHLAHKLEDLLQILQSGEGDNLEDGWAVFEWGVTEVALLLNQARTQDIVTADPALLAILASFKPSESSIAIAPEPSNRSSTLIKTALTEDLEACLTRLEQLSPDDADMGDQMVTFFDECLLLGETLGLDWLVETIEPLETVLETAPALEAWQVALGIVNDLRSQRDQFLLEQSTPPTPQAQPELIAEKALSHLRVPLPRLERMTHQVEEMIFVKERLRLQQQTLEQALRRLQQLSRQFEPIRDRVQSVYDQLAIAPMGVTSRYAIAGGVVANLGSKIVKNEPLNLFNREFDALELDRYSELHSSLQSFQELMLRVQETRTDLDLVNRELTDDLEQAEIHLDQLYKNVNESRLVPFGLLARRFLPHIQSLNLRGDKSVELVIEGEDIFIDQVLLEQLQIPLMHLINNAFDHGIESTSERLALDKSPLAKIRLTARVEQNQLLLQLEDDGRGIDCDRVYQKAIERGLCNPDLTFEQLSTKTVLEWIFCSEFSTAETISDLSGRGVGLDVVRTQIRRLRGSIQVSTQNGLGTCFTLKLPLNLSLQSLFLVQWQRRLLAIPTLSVLESFPYRELTWLPSETPTAIWREIPIPVVPLSQLLPYASLPTDTVPPSVVMVLNSANGPLAIAVDTLITERQLIVKPFDETVIVPPYLAGCTILGTGEVVPVLLPQAFELPSLDREAINHHPSILPKRQPPTIMIVEDSVATRRLLERLLTEVGCRVITCRDGQEAWDTLPQYENRIHLLISDVEMPRMNGFELLQKLRAHSVWKMLPVVMATSRTGERHREKAIALGATAYLSKPIQPQELLSLVEPLFSH